MGTVVRLLLLGLLLTTTPSTCLGWLSGLRSETYDIGRQSGVTIDGDPTDWVLPFFSIGPLVPTGDAAPAPYDYDIDLRMAWDDSGILLCFLIRDDVADTSLAAAVGSHDSVALRVSDGLGSDRYLIATVASGSTDKPGRARVTVDERSTAAAEIDAARSPYEGGIAIEVRVPLDVWGGARPGREFTVQVIARDRDDDGGDLLLPWFPWVDLSVGGMSHVVRLSETGGEPIPGTARGTYPDLLKTHVVVICDGSLAGQTAILRDGDVELTSGVLEMSQGRGRATLVTQVPERGHPFDEPNVLVTGHGRIPVTIQNADDARAWRFASYRVLFEDYAFSAEEFPVPKLEDPLFAEHLIGPYTLSALYYGQNYNRVAKPTSDGRYGAVVSIVAEGGGTTYTRFRTLYKYSGRIDWWEDVSSTIELPDAFGIDPVVLEDKQNTVSEHLKWQFRSSLRRDQRVGALLAGLRESVPGEGRDSVYEDAWTRDRAWWLGLKRQVYGMPAADPLQCPTGVYKGRARELVFGSEEEAGVVSGFSEAVDSVCTAWWEDSQEPFSICVARLGKVVSLKSYGFRQGKPVTLSTKAPISWITKLLTGALMAMVIEHKRVDPDAPISTYLPAFRNVPAGQALTVRQLMNHTSGLSGHWGDGQNDFEELMAGYSPLMAIGKTYRYNGAGFALAGKVLESVSGETVPGFIKQHLLDPLGCSGTAVSGTSWDGESTPLDLARIGQMLLNGGAYGDFRFFEDEAFQEMLPRGLSSFVPGTYRQYGLGTMPYPTEGLGAGTFGHDSGSSTIFRVDPENDLVIVVMRWQSGPNYGYYKNRLFETIVSHLPKTSDS